MGLWNSCTSFHGRADVFLAVRLFGASLSVVYPTPIRLLLASYTLPVALLPVLPDS